MLESPLQYSCRRQVCNFIKKESLTQVHSCEFYKKFEEHLFLEHLQWLLRKVQSTVKMYAQVFFWNNTCFTGLLLKFNGRWNVFLILQEKMTSCAWMLGLVLKLIFDWLAEAFILLKSLFKLVTDKFILSTTETMERSSVKNLESVVIPSEKSFM